MRRKKVKITVSFVRRSKIAERFKHRDAIEDRRSRSDLSIDRSITSIAKRCDRRSRSDRSIAKRCPRGIAEDDAPGGKERSPPRRVYPPARHHRAIADAPRDIILLTSRDSIYLYLNIHYIIIYRVYIYIDNSEFQIRSNLNAQM